MHMVVGILEIMHVAPPAVLLPDFLLREVYSSCRTFPTRLMYSCASRHIASADAFVSRRRERVRANERVPKGGIVGLRLPSKIMPMSALPAQNRRIAVSASSFEPMISPREDDSSSKLLLLPPRENGGAVVTGAAGGVGFALSRALLRHGYDVLLSDVQADAVARAAEALNADQTVTGCAFSICTDVSSSDDIQALAEAASTHLGRVQLWVNNAGVNGGRVPLKHQSPQTYAPTIMPTQRKTLFAH